MSDQELHRRKEACAHARGATVTTTNTDIAGLCKGADKIRLIISSLPYRYISSTALFDNSSSLIYNSISTTY